MGADAQLGTVQGRVRGVEGSAVFGATVSLFRGGTRAFVTDTDRLGSFRITDVTPGPWEVVSLRSGMRSISKPWSLDWPGRWR